MVFFDISDDGCKIVVSENYVSGFFGNIIVMVFYGNVNICLF